MGYGAQEEVVALVLSEEQDGRLHGARVAQDRHRTRKEELADEHANRDQQDQKACADHHHRGVVGGAYAHQCGAGGARVAQLDHDPEGEEEHEHELHHAVESVV